MGGSRVKLPLSVQTLSVSKRHSWFTYDRVVNTLKGYQSTRPWKAQQRQTNALQHLGHHGSRSIPTIVFSDHNAHVQVFVAYNRTSWLYVLESNICKWAKCLIFGVEGRYHDPWYIWYRLIFMFPSPQLSACACLFDEMRQADSSHWRI